MPRISLPDFYDCPKCKGKKACMKYTRTQTKNGIKSASYLCNDCNKHLKLEFGVINSLT